MKIMLVPLFTFAIGFPFTAGAPYTNGRDNWFREEPYTHKESIHRGRYISQAERERELLEKGRHVANVLKNCLMPSFFREHFQAPPEKGLAPDDNVYRALQEMEMTYTLTKSIAESTVILEQDTKDFLVLAEQDYQRELAALKRKKPPSEINSESLTQEEIQQKVYKMSPEELEKSIMESCQFDISFQSEFYSFAIRSMDNMSAAIHMILDTPGPFPEEARHNIERALNAYHKTRDRMYGN